MPMGVVCIRHMLIVPPTPFRGRRRIEAPAAPAPPFALALVSAEYDSDALRLLLTFNQAVSIGSFAGNQITVLDTDITGLSYHGRTASQPTSGSVLMGLFQFQGSVMSCATRSMRCSPAGSRRSS